MKRSIPLPVIVAVLGLVLVSSPAGAAERWSAQRAQSWYGAQPWILGMQPGVWHHDLLRADGTPYREREVEILRSLSAPPKGVVPGTLRLGGADSR